MFAVTLGMFLLVQCYCAQENGEEALITMRGSVKRQIQQTTWGSKFFLIGQANPRFFSINVLGKRLSAVPGK